VKADLILVGGGLANSLLACRLRALRPELRIVMIERQAALGGNHTWSFHGSDISARQLDWLRPMIERSWSAHDLRFPERERRLPGTYHSVFAEGLDRVVRPMLGDGLLAGASVTQVEPRAVTLADGRRLEAPAVIDGRGDPGERHLDVRFQKFLGWLVELDGDADLELPLLMDATVAQEDGFRFMYTLPFGRRRLLIEDTRYSDTPSLDRQPMREAIRDYAVERGWRIAEVLREEEGALPVVLGGDLDGYWAAAPGVPRSGVRAGLFHYTTGYSLPEAVRLADDVARLPELTSEALYGWIRARSYALWRRGRFFRLLNRMLFLAGPAAERYRVLQHFYRLPADLIGRFYAGTPTLADRCRILSGRPPVPVGRALASAFGARGVARDAAAGQSS
jgi:lycopene beta-cyclase